MRVWGRACGVAVAWLACAVRAQPAPVDLGDLFLAAARWEMKADAFLESYQGAGFRFVDGRQTALSTQRDALRFLGLDVYEARVYFSAEGLRRVEVSLYNKGDAGIKDKTSFDALSDAVKAKLTGRLQEAGMTGRTSSDRPNYVVRRHQWVKRSPGVLLEWAYVEPHRSGGKNMPYSAEFIKVLLMPLKGAGGMTAMEGTLGERRPKSARTIKENVTRNAAGDVWVDHVPMVDQGQKGYCAAAASERVLRYYGIEVDQHQIAQLAETAAEGGTTLDGMAKAVAKVGRQFQLDKKELIASEAGVSFEKSDHAKLLDDYNALARKKKAAQIDWMTYTTDNVVDIQGVWRAMDPEILLAARVSQRQAMSQFVRQIALYVDQGVPLLWSCLVGQYPEEPPLGEEGAFGHIRLIIGYNTKTKEVLYSDSWGPAHALKRLPVDRAWAMTKGLVVLKPRGVR